MRTPCSLLVLLSNSIQAGSGSDSIVMAGTGPSSAMTANNIDLGVGTDTIKFTAATNADTVTVTNTTITGAKRLVYEKTASNVAITTGAGADYVIFQDTQDLEGVISTNSGNDSIQFLRTLTSTLRFRCWC